MGYPKSIKINGRERIAVNAFSSGPGCTPHTYALETGIRGRVEYVRRAACGWILENGATWIPEVSGFGQHVEVTT
jgi:hypothetical protein